MVVGAPGAVPKELEKHMKTLKLDKISPSQLQETALLVTTHILQK